MISNESDSLESVKKQLAKSFEVNEKNLSLWLNWHGGSEGKLIRSHLALSTGEALGLSKHTAIIWAVVCELIHSASLLHDDICDSDEIRRGKVSVWKNFGIPAAICTGDYLIAESFKKITEIEQGWHQNILLGLLSGTVKEIVFGQSGDVNTSFLSLGWEEYKSLATAKTSPLICLPIMGMFKCAELDEPYYINLRKMTDEIGLAYQIVNDLENILLNQADEIPTDIEFERMNALLVLVKEKSSEKEINFLKKNKAEFKQFLISSNIKDDLIDRIQLILENIKNSLHLMPVVIRPIISSLCEEINKKASQFTYAK
ncbi:MULTISPECIES: polyprenyl synthetase family protein [Candidatus Methylopumilus]|uniref:polyprenyl synthetase family protein n=1 Tax=Candidatus Methylopumilus TaxID=1679002 RepID=UPI00111FDCDF|nr:polyprenyl synthetase family protein [Candidatus Methylopumilus universalis]QDC78796.1 polyprenyl synthetase family protein [Candidatus Methylopumilus universalis]